MACIQTNTPYVLCVVMKTLTETDCEHWTAKPVSLRLTAPAVGCRTSRVGGGPPLALPSSAVELREQVEISFLIMPLGTCFG